MAVIDVTSVIIGFMGTTATIGLTVLTLWITGRRKRDEVAARATENERNFEMRLRELDVLIRDNYNEEHHRKFERSQAR